MPTSLVAWVLAILVITQDVGTAAWSRIDLFGGSWWSVPTMVRLAADLAAVILLLLPGVPVWLAAVLLTAWLADHGLRIRESLTRRADGFFPSLVFVVGGATRAALVLLCLVVLLVSSTQTRADLASSAGKEGDHSVSSLQDPQQEPQEDPGTAAAEPTESSGAQETLQPTETAEFPAQAQESSVRDGGIAAEFRSGRDLSWAQIQPGRRLALSGPATAVHGGRIWLLGGGDPSLPRGQESYRVDPGTGAVQQYRSPWPSRQGAAAVSFRGELWLIGGQGNVPLNDVWSSRDGITWTFRGNAPFLGRWDHALSVIGDQLVVTGGTDGQRAFSDTWSSEDGLTWRRLGTGPWDGRGGHRVVVTDERLFLAGGRGSDGQALSDLWSAWLADDELQWEAAGTLVPMQGHAMFADGSGLLLLVLQDDQMTALRVPLSRRGAPRMDRVQRSAAGLAPWSGATGLEVAGNQYFVGGSREGRAEAALLRRLD